jgi:ABC-2 type transport system ATP-binding protein
MSRLPDDVAIRVHEIRKDFHLPHNNEDSIKHKIITAFEKKDKDVDTLHALRGISFDIKKGEFFGILGRNGSGKSTLLKIISDIYTPTKGTVSRQGRLVAFIELGVGFNPQLTGRENVFLNAALLGFSRKETEAMYSVIVVFAELEDFMEQKLKNYSSGMKVRLAFSVAIRADADILILDEVLAVGDAAFQRKCYDYFKDLKRRNKTIVFVTHSMGAVREYCDKAILIEEGKITHQGEADEVANAYTMLFNRPEGNKVQQSDDRWGSSEAQFTKIETTVTNEHVTIRAEFKGMDTKQVDTLIGMDIYNHKGVLIAGARGKEKAERQFGLAKDETRRLDYVFENLFGDGDFVVNLSLKSHDGTYIYDFWKGATGFTNSRNLSAYFPVVIPVKVTEKH